MTFTIIIQIIKSNRSEIYQLWFHNILTKTEDDLKRPTASKKRPETT